MSTLSPSTRIEPRESALATTIDGEAVVLETESGTYFGLNEVATFCWEELDEPRTLEALCDAVVEEFDVDRETCEADVEALVEDLAERGLVDLEEDGD